MITYKISFIWIDENPDHDKAVIPMFNLLCMKSVMIKNPDAEIVLYTNKPADMGVIRGGLGSLNLVKRLFNLPIPTRFFEEIDRIGITHVSHKSDYIRYSILSLSGGIYCDMDVIALRSFAPLLSHDLVIAKQSPAVICSGVIMCIPKHPAIVKTLESYSTDYQPDKWAYNAMTVLKKNAQESSCLCTILKEKNGFHYPNYLRIDDLLKWDLDAKAPENLYCHHIFTFSKGGQRIVDDIINHRSEWISSPRNYLEKLMKEVIEFR